MPKEGTKTGIITKMIRLRLVPVCPRHPNFLAPHTTNYRHLMVLLTRMGVRVLPAMRAITLLPTLCPGGRLCRRWAKVMLSLLALRLTRRSMFTARALVMDLPPVSHSHSLPLRNSNHQCSLPHPSMARSRTQLLLRCRPHNQHNRATMVDTPSRLRPRSVQRMRHLSLLHKLSG